MKKYNYLDKYDTTKIKNKGNKMAKNTKANRDKLEGVMYRKIANSKNLKAIHEMKKDLSELKYDETFNKLWKAFGMDKTTRIVHLVINKEKHEKLKAIAKLTGNDPNSFCTDALEYYSDHLPKEIQEKINKRITG